ncbi:hypothetical protein SNE25_22175 [Mucilaginibacter sabulilitoris]|uniref:Transglutaminase-like domain-containing protein n=1 Tax=Mucilaginibacter sabulilitoris TaxID=1173583 RepID=A0ABZ0TKF7_9SPHI|nr:hypothetical protein [Mucilaginibacter sabulilitoris]WPU92030.1 hypothetical protein SNE25_22175 [Mucilaginibacter sabulilitoris]
MCRFIKYLVVVLMLTANNLYGQDSSRRFSFEFYEGTFNTAADTSIIINSSLKFSSAGINAFYNRLNAGKYQSVINDLLNFKEKYQLNDWLYYQLIRRTAQQISPKEDNYGNYTMYKWFLLSKSGYDARLALTTDKIIFYVYNNEDISDIPFFMIDGKKYMCLNIHDYPNTNLNQDPPVPVNINMPEAKKAFSYKVTRMPDFTPENYIEKELQFTYRHKVYYFNIKLNPDVERIFTNYPGVDFESYFNIPLSKETYGSLIPLLKKNTAKMSQKKGVDYLMHFTRYAFLYEDDNANFGKEKRLSPEETLFSKYSDCDDRAALFFYLVKEIYNLPMIALLYPTHIGMAVQFDKPVGNTIIYKGKTYSYCEPTPQQKDLQIGQISAKLKKIPYQVVYQYNP